MHRLVFVAALAAAPAFAQVHVDVQLPSISFEVAPPLVVVAPGIQVVPDYQEEVFFTDGWYWHRRGEVWYRTHDHRGTWVVVERRGVPAALMKLPPGQYRKFHPREVHEEREHDKGHGHGKGKR